MKRHSWYGDWLRVFCASLILIGVRLPDRVIAPARTCRMDTGTWHLSGPPNGSRAVPYIAWTGKKVLLKDMNRVLITKVDRSSVRF